MKISPRGLDVERKRIVDLADQVVQRHIVIADLNDGTLTTLLAELRRRGYRLQPRHATDPDRTRYPFRFRVAQQEALGGG